MEQIEMTINMRGGFVKHCANAEPPKTRLRFVEIRRKVFLITPGVTGD